MLVVLPLLLLLALYNPQYSGILCTSDELWTDEEHGHQQSNGSVHVFTAAFGTCTVVAIVSVVFVVILIAVVKKTFMALSRRIFVHASRVTQHFISSKTIRRARCRRQHRRRAKTRLLAVG